MSTVKQKNKVVPNNPDLKIFLDGLDNIFSDLSTESKLGSEMVAQNSTTEFSEFINDVMKNPLKHSYEAFKMSAVVIQDLLEQAVHGFFIENKVLIKKVVRPHKSNNLYYAIVLKSDSAINRSKILSFVNKYNGTAISRNFSITFNFIPSELEKDLIKGEVINIK